MAKPSSASVGASGKRLQVSAIFGDCVLQSGTLPPVDRIRYRIQIPEMREAPGSPGAPEQELGPPSLLKLALSSTTALFKKPPQAAGETFTSPEKL
jgi:hypothetical protein